jgi:hypothetical protein
MGLVIVAQTAELLEQKQAVLSETDKEFVLQFAFATGDKELTDKLIEELSEPDADKGAVYQKYETLTGFQPDWIRKIENLLVSLEMYRIQEEKAVRTLSEILTAYGAELTVDEIKEIPPDKVREQLSRKEAVQR